MAAQVSIATLQTFVILPKQKTTVWVRQNVKFFPQNGSVMKIEQNWACSAKSSQVARMNKNPFCSVGEKNFFLLSMLSIAYFSLLANFCKTGYKFFPTKFLIFFLCGIENVFSVTVISYAYSRSGNTHLVMSCTSSLSTRRANIFYWNPISLHF